MIGNAKLRSMRLLLGFSFFCTPAFAQPIAASAVHSVGPSLFFGGMAVDAATGEAYQLNGYEPGLYGSGGTSPTTITRFADISSFDAGVDGVTVASGVNLWGTYIAAQAGSVYGRSSVNGIGFTWPSDAFTSKISGATGTVQASMEVVNMVGANDGVD